MFSRLIAPHDRGRPCWPSFAMSSGCGGDAQWPRRPLAPLTPPAILAVSPTRGSTGGGTTVTITGCGFRSGAAGDAR